MMSIVGESSRSSVQSPLQADNCKPLQLNDLLARSLARPPIWALRGLRAALSPRGSPASRFKLLLRRRRRRRRPESEQAAAAAAAEQQCNHLKESLLTGACQLCEISLVRPSARWQALFSLGLLQAGLQSAQTSSRPTTLAERPAGATKSRLSCARNAPSQTLPGAQLSRKAEKQSGQPLQFTSCTPGVSRARPE